MSYESERETMKVVVNATREQDQVIIDLVAHLKKGNKQGNGKHRVRNKR